MAVQFQVTPEYLEAQACRVEAQYSQYKTMWTRIYTEKDSLQRYWTGEANQAYCTQLEGFRNDFVNLEKVLIAYKDYIRAAGKKYSETDKGLADAARSTLTVGK